MIFDFTFLNPYLFCAYCCILKIILNSVIVLYVCTENVHQIYHHKNVRPPTDLLVVNIITNVIIVVRSHVKWLRIGDHVVK